MLYQSMGFGNRYPGLSPNCYFLYTWHTQVIKLLFWLSLLLRLIVQFYSKRLLSTATSWSLFKALELQQLLTRRIRFPSSGTCILVTLDIVRRLQTRRDGPVKLSACLIHKANKCASNAYGDWSYLWEDKDTVISHLKLNSGKILH